MKGGREGGRKEIKKKGRKEEMERKRKEISKEPCKIIFLVELD